MIARLLSWIGGKLRWYQPPTISNNFANLDYFGDNNRKKKW